MDTWLGLHSSVFECPGAQIAQLRVASPRIIEPLDIVEHIGAGGIAGAVDLAGRPLSIAELSQTLPARLIEQIIPLSRSRRWNCSLVYCEPWSE